MSAMSKVVTKGEKDLFLLSPVKCEEFPLTYLWKVSSTDSSIIIGPSGSTEKDKSSVDPQNEDVIKAKLKEKGVKNPFVCYYDSKDDVSVIMWIDLADISNCNIDYPSDENEEDEDEGDPLFHKKELVQWKLHAITHSSQGFETFSNKLRAEGIIKIDDDVLDELLDEIDDMGIEEKRKKLIPAIADAKSEDELKKKDADLDKYVKVINRCITVVSNNIVMPEPPSEPQSGSASSSNPALGMCSGGCSVNFSEFKSVENELKQERDRNSKLEKEKSKLEGENKDLRMKINFLEKQLKDKDDELENDKKEMQKAHDDEKKKLEEEKGELTQQLEDQRKKFDDDMLEAKKAFDDEKKKLVESFEAKKVEMEGVFDDEKKGIQGAYDDEKKKLQQDKDELTKQLQDQNEKYETDMMEAQETKEALEDEKKQLEDEKRRLEDEKRRLEDEKRRSEDEKKRMQKAFEEEKKKLEQDKKELKEQLEAQNEKYDTDMMMAQEAAEAEKAKLLESFDAEKLKMKTVFDGGMNDMQGRVKKLEQDQKKWEEEKRELEDGLKKAKETSNKTGDTGEHFTYLPVTFFPFKNAKGNYVFKCDGDSENDSSTVYCLDSDSLPLLRNYDGISPIKCCVSYVSEPEPESYKNRRAYYGVEEGKRIVICSTSHAVIFKLSK